MRVLVVENDSVTALGQVETALREAGAEIVLCRPHAGEALPAGEVSHDALVVMGGSQSAIDDEKHPYLPDLAALMRRYGDAGKSVLGVCLGSQLLARGYGATNLIGAAAEFGWCDVHRTDEELTDPLLALGRWHVPDLPMAWRYFHAAGWGDASGAQCDRRQPGLSHRSRGLRDAVSFRGRPNRCRALARRLSRSDGACVARMA